MRLIVTMITVVLLVAVAAPALAHGGYRERNSAIIHKVFGKHGDAAVRVARCESGLTIGATNGIYWGLFQVSDHWRRTVPGWGWNAWAQARHAYRVFRLTGSDWSHWECRP
jgi:hypothetical protein